MNFNIKLIFRHKVFMLLLFIAPIPFYSQTQKLENNSALKIEIKGKSPENKISLQLFSKIDSLELSGDNANDFKIIGGEINFISGGTMISFNYPGCQIPLELKNEISKMKTGKLLFEKTRVKQISTGKIYAIPELKISITNP
jgi:hypothetical protein